jgi:hypothetical protein
MTGTRRIALLVVLAAAACYRPNIQNGGFFCADGGVCPEGFRCNTMDNRCYQGDAGPEVQMCTDAAPATFSVCSDPPVGGECSPACQNGCTCGRCAVVAGASACINVGPKMVGEACNTAADDCGTGLGCLKECGSNLGRCFQFCGPNTACSGNLLCNVPIPATTFMACDVAPSSCNPVGSAAATSCPHSAVACYVSGADTKCDCPGTAMADKDCAVFNDCIPGYQCVSQSGKTTCRQVCQTAADCTPPNTRCVPSGGNYGFCST